MSNESSTVIAVYYYKPDSYDEQLKKLYSAWGLEFLSKSGISAEELEKTGFKVVFEPKQPKWRTCKDSLNSKQNTVNEVVIYKRQTKT